MSILTKSVPALSKPEGAFYVWTREEFDVVLGDDAKIAAAFWNVKPKGNVDPSHDARNELKGKVRSPSIVGKWSKSLSFA